MNLDLIVVLQGAIAIIIGGGVVGLIKSHKGVSGEIGKLRNCFDKQIGEVKGSLSVINQWQVQHEKLDDERSAGNKQAIDSLWQKIDRIEKRP